MVNKTHLQWTCERFAWYAPFRVVVEGNLLFVVVVVVGDKGSMGQNINQCRLLKVLRYQVVHKQTARISIASVT